MELHYQKEYLCQRPLFPNICVFTLLLQTVYFSYEVSLNLYNVILSLLIAFVLILNVFA